MIKFTSIRYKINVIPVDYWFSYVQVNDWFATILEDLMHSQIAACKIDTWAGRHE